MIRVALRSLREFAAVLVIMLPAVASAQIEVARLSGRISSPQGLPVAGADVTIGGSFRTTSDTSGEFVVDNVLRGSTRMLVRAIGFAPVDTVIAITGAQHAIMVVMYPRVHILTPAVTEAVLPYGKPLRYQHTSKFDDFYERRARRPGTFFTREDIERGGRNNVFELMSSVPGVIAGTRPGGIPYVRIARCVGSSIRVGGATPWLALYVNGQRIRGGGGADVLEYLSQLKAGDVETVEVYRGPSQLPMEAVGDACAAVFVTTRFTAGSVLPKR